VIREFLLWWGAPTAVVLLGALLAVVVPFEKSQCPLPADAKCFIKEPGMLVTIPCPGVDRGAF
jgi:hypothetical protein